MKNIKVLVVDDEADILEFLSYNLKKENYDVFTAQSGDAAIELAAKIIPDIIVLDLMMPGKDGIVTCVELKQNEKLRSSSIIFLTARNEEYLQIAGLDAGAEDYITKPIKPQLFLARINSVARRHFSDNESQIKMEFNSLLIDRDKVLVTKHGLEVPLTKKEYEILLDELRRYNPEMLDKDRLIVVSKSDMLDEVMEEQMKSELPEDIDHVFISSLTTKGIMKLKDMIWQTIH